MDKKVNKSIKKTSEPAYVVDATKCESGKDLKLAFIFAKANNAIITEEELVFLIETVIELTLDLKHTVDSVILGSVHMLETCLKKQPWYKRFWNWLTNKK